MKNIFSFLSFGKKKDAEGANNAEVQTPINPDPSAVAPAPPSQDVSSVPAPDQSTVTSEPAASTENVSFGPPNSSTETTQTTSPDPATPVPSESQDTVGSDVSEQPQADENGVQPAPEGSSSSEEEKQQPPSSASV